jgi:hypothetical protein
MKILQLLLLLGCNFPAANAWILSSPHARRAERKSTKRADAATPPDGTFTNAKIPPDFSGKSIYQRIFYRLSPLSDVAVQNSIVIEERVRFVADPDRANIRSVGVVPTGLRTIILRNGNNATDGTAGKEFYAINVHDEPTSKHHNGAGFDPKLQSNIATALYLASCPDLVARGRVLELSSHLGALLGCIGAGFVAHGRPTKKEEVDILTVPSWYDSLLPEGLEKLTLSNPDQQDLATVLENVKNSGIHASKVKCESIDWTARDARLKSLGEFRAIIASDLAYTYADTKMLARAIANHLEPSYPYIYSKDTLPKFVHVCPDTRDETAHLHRLLEKVRTFLRCLQ